METINHMASSAVKAVWGEDEQDKQEHSESHREPISGVTGVVSRGEPYDAGNMDEETQRKVEREIAQNEEDADQVTAGIIEPHSTEVKSTPTSQTPPPYPSSAPTHRDKDNDQEKDKGKDVVHDELDDAAEPRLSGPGPRPLQDVARDAPGKDAQPKKEPAEAEHAHGEGEHYVRTTGLAADGGDFDATKPGAGREADRLMAEKGIQHAEEESAKASQAGSSHGKDKPSLGERIKHKLHKHN